MDPETYLRHIVGEVSHCLTAYAEDHQWVNEDYWIYYHINSQWGGVNFIFVSTHFDGSDERQNYRNVWDFLIQEFADKPEMLKPVTVSVWGKSQVDRGGLYSIPPGYAEYWTVTPVARTGSS